MHLQLPAQDPILVINYLVFTSLLLMPVISIGRLASREKKHGLNLFFLGLLWMWLFSMLDAVAYITQNLLLTQINNSLVISMCLLFYLLFFNYAFKEQLDMFTVLVEILLVFLINFMAWAGFFTSEADLATFLIENTVFTWNLSNLLVCVVLCLVFTWIAFTYARVPRRLKKGARLLVIAGIISLSEPVALQFLIIPILVPITILPGIFLAVALNRYPELIHVLPFKIFTLVVSKKGGVPCFSYDWTEPDSSDSQTFKLSSLLFALETMGREAIQKGMLEHIELAEGSLLLNISHDSFKFGLLASRNSKMLRDALDLFSKKFTEKFASPEILNKPVDSLAFEGAKQLVLDCFPWS